MSDFDLVPVDGGDPIHLPPGETVVGRGPLLRVNDKRVSRHHGLLENLNGELRLKPTHVNPCFVQSSLTDDPRPLQRDSWYPLHHGDLFSLLPGQYIYKVVAVGGDDRTPRNSQMFEEEEEEEGLPVSHKPDVEPPPPIRQDSGQTPPDEEPTAAALSNQDDTPDSPDRKSLNTGDCAQPKEVEDDQSKVTPSEPKRRVLPAWMMAAAAHTSSSSPKVQSAVKRSKGAAAASTSTKRTAAKPVKTSSPEEAELSEEEMPKKRRRKMHVEEEEEEEAPSKTDVPSERPTVRLQTESNRSEVSDAEADSFTMETEEEERGGGASTAHISTMTPPYESTQPENEDKKLKNGRQATKRAESVGSNSGSAPGATALKPHLRTPCPYGKDCYRKNPIHFQECSHPGDTDYEEEEEETEEADRPECPYGTDCYRKNPLHRKEYKHTKRPARTTRPIPKNTPADDEDEDEDEDLGDDSFINDDSEDVGDDSDYIPPDSDDSGKEDIKRLQKEAKAFVKRRK